jgi:DNA-binding YbaB/EbfC family protein
VPHVCPDASVTNVGRCWALYVTSVKIDPQVVDPNDVEMLEDLIAAAFNDASRKADETTEAKMGKLTGGMPGLPGGLKLPF